MPGSEATVIRIDDIIAALLMSLAMLRRLEAKSAPSEGVDVRAFRHWQVQAVAIYGRVAVMCLAKIVLNLSWQAIATAASFHRGWLQGGGAVIFMAWAVAMVFAWRRSTDVHHLRLSLGISLRRGRPTKTAE